MQRLLISNLAEKYFPIIPTYYGATANKSADNLLDSIALVAVSSTLNSDLYAIINNNFAYIFTIFSSAVSTENRRIQIAISYSASPTKIAIRTYGGSGWTAWKGISLLDSPTFTGTPSAPTATTGTKTTQIATCQFVNNSRCYPSPVVGASSLPYSSLDSCRTTLIAALSSSDLSSVKSVPSEHPGIVRITSAGSYCVQEYFDSNGMYYTRFYNGSSWYGWKAYTSALI